MRSLLNRIIKEYNIVYCSHTSHRPLTHFSQTAHRLLTDSNKPLTDRSHTSHRTLADFLQTAHILLTDRLHTSHRPAYRLSQARLQTAHRLQISHRPAYRPAHRPAHRNKYMIIIQCLHGPMVLMLTNHVLVRGPNNGLSLNLVLLSPSLPVRSGWA